VVIDVTGEEPDIAASLEHVADALFELCICVLLESCVEVLLLYACGECHVVEFVTNSLDVRLVKISVGPLLGELLLDLFEECLHVFVGHIIDLEHGFFDVIWHRVIEA
jgi:hypothetical protein